MARRLAGYNKPIRSAVPPLSWPVRTGSARLACGAGAASTARVEGAEHVVVAGGGVGALDLGVHEGHGATGDVDPAAHARAVAAAAVAARGLVVGDGAILDARGGVVEVNAAAEAVAAVNARAAGDHVAGDGRIRDGQERGDAVLVGAEDAAA